MHDRAVRILRFSPRSKPRTSFLRIRPPGGPFAPERRPPASWPGRGPRTKRRVTFERRTRVGFKCSLTVPRYVDTFEAEEDVDIVEVQKEIDGPEDELAALRVRMREHLKELGVDA